MSTPTLQQARSHYQGQRRIVALAVLAARRLFAQNRPLSEIVTTVSAYQYASALASTRAVADMATESAPTPLVTASTFAGVSSHGFPISEPIIATIDQYAPAPLEPLPANWWTEAQEFMASVEQLIASEVADAGRSASQAEFVARPDWTNYVRMLNPPSCSRCAILAGRIYRDLEEFERHPLCDCVMVPVTDWQDAHDKGLVSSAQEAFDKGLIRTKVRKDGTEYRPGFSRADERAIRDGADIAQVVNAHRGMVSADVFGRRVKATTYGTTRRAAWRKANPTRLVRLRPESIYKFAENREDAIRLLRLYGYLTS